MNRPLTEHEVTRAQDLLTARATEGVTEEEAAELAALGVHEDGSFELAAAAIDLAMLRIQPMPEGLADKILANAGVVPRSSGLVSAHGMPTIAGVAPPRRMASPSSPPVTVPAPSPHPGATVTPIASARRSRAPLVVAWTIATVAVAAAATAIIYVRTQRPKLETITKVEYRDVVKMVQTPSPLAARAELLATAKDVKTITWTATKDDAAKGASGDVVWSPSLQKGYMRFVNLAPNDPRKLQYQLWIFDKTRDAKFPVDGGVFDVSSTGEVIVPISAKLAVADPTLFAVTVEVPGGVVVSKRERIVVTATPG